MKKIILSIIALSMLLFSLTSCIRIDGTWTYFLPNGCIIHYYDSYHVYIEKKNENEDPYRMLEELYITKFFVYDDYVGLKYAVVDENEYMMEYQDHYTEDDGEQYEFYIADTLNFVAMGPFSEMEFYLECLKLGISDFNWIRMSPRPKDSIRDYDMIMQKKYAGKDE